MIQGVVGLGMMVWRQVTPRWDNDHGWIHGGWQGKEGKGMSGYTSPGIHRVAGVKGRSGNKNNSYATISNRA